tara:strand:+ start:2824 stop:3105 length:282 start_codon:yes stop_codon:yes gene_type:complete
MLLGLKGTQFSGQLCRYCRILQVDEAPSFELRPVRKIQIFAQSVSRPATTALNSFAAPYASSAIEVKEATGPIAGAVFQDKVAVQQDCFQSSQ